MFTRSATGLRFRFRDGERMGKSKKKTLSPEAYARIDATVAPLATAFQEWRLASPTIEEEGRTAARLYDDEKALIAAFDAWKTTLLWEIGES